jgi:hypothetical protein
MCKRLVVLALFLVAISPIPGQTANNPAGSSGNVQKQQGEGKSNGKSAATSLPQNSARPAPQDTEKPNTENTGNSVTVSKLPPVSIGKDWADWSYWGFGGILVVVGSLQVWFLYRTLKGIQTQAGHMECQTKILEDSVAAAQKVADAAEIQAKAAMGVAVPTLVVHGFSFVNTGRQNPAVFYRQPRVRLVLKNYGKSPAFLRKYSIGYSWGELAPKKFTWYPFEDQVVDAGASYELREVDLEVADSPPGGVIGDLVSGKRKLVFSGWISYRDVFDSPTRKLPVCRELTVYDSDPSEMTVMDTSDSALKLWTDPSED